MARNIASFCMWSVFLFLSLGQTCLTGAEIGFDFNRLSEIPESENTGAFRDRLGSLASPPCCFLRLQRAHKSALSPKINETDSVTKICPILAEYGTDDRSAKVWNAMSSILTHQYQDLAAMLEAPMNRVSQFSNQCAIQTICENFSQAKDLVSTIRLPFILNSDATYSVNHRDYREPDSIELPRPNSRETDHESDHETDRYWQYYEDCDYWQVIFAWASYESRLQAAHLSTNYSMSHSGYPLGQIIQGLATRNVMLIIGPSKLMIGQICETVSGRLRMAEFRIVETPNIKIVKRSKLLLRSIVKELEWRFDFVSQLATKSNLQQLASAVQSLASDSPFQISCRNTATAEEPALPRYQAYRCSSLR